MELLINVAISLIMGILTAYFASKRGRNTIAWFFIGMLLGVFGILILFLLPRIDSSIAQVVTPIPINRDESKPLEAEIESLDWFYLDKMHTQFGPVSERNLKDLFAQGLIASTSFVWRKGMESWKKIEELPGLEALLRK